MKPAPAPEPRAFEAIIFDGEGVVIDTEPIWDRVQEMLLARRGISYDRNVLKPLLTGRSSLESATIIRDHYKLPDEVSALDAERKLLLRDYLAKGVGFVPGFREFFGRINGTYETALATAMDSALFELVSARLRLWTLFKDRIFTLEHEGLRSKPEPDLFLFAASSLDVEPTDCLVIEDSPHGIEAARRAGMGSVGITTTYPADLLKRADMVVSSFDEIRDADLLVHTT